MTNLTSVVIENGKVISTSGIRKAVYDKKSIKFYYDKENAYYFIASEEKFKLNGSWHSEGSNSEKSLHYNYSNERGIMQLSTWEGELDGTRVGMVVLDRKGRTILGCYNVKAVNLENCKVFIEIDDHQSCSFDVFPEDIRNSTCFLNGYQTDYQLKYSCIYEEDRIVIMIPENDMKELSDNIDDEDIIEALSIGEAMHNKEELAKEFNTTEALMELHLEKLKKRGLLTFSSRSGNVILNTRY